MVELKDPSTYTFKTLHWVHDSTKIQRYLPPLLTTLVRTIIIDQNFFHIISPRVEKPCMKSIDSYRVLRIIDSFFAFAFVKHHLLITLSSKITKMGAVCQTHLISVIFFSSILFVTMCMHIHKKKQDSPQQDL